MSREYTPDEIRAMFLDHINTMVKYWAGLDEPVEWKLHGLAFSIMKVLDGCTHLPRFIVAPLSCEEDKQFYIEEGDDYFPVNTEIAKVINGDIAGCLHELLPLPQVIPNIPAKHRPH